VNLGRTVNALTLLPSFKGLHGPVTQAKLMRLVLAYGLLCALGFLLARTASGHWQVLGMGLLAPGAGFLAHAELCGRSGLWHGLAAAGAMGAFGLSVLLWFGTGNIVAPPLVWLGAAVWAACAQAGPVQPWVLDRLHSAWATVCLVAGLVMWGWQALCRRQRDLDNAYLIQQGPQLQTIFTAPAQKVEGAEMSWSDLQRLRFALDRALQPVDQFEGFEHRDPFQTAALRYQLNFLGYAIAVNQARYAPACRAYLQEAQERLLSKQAQHRVWSYWALESLWGHLRWQPDPVARENIMYVGFVALQMGLHQASTGSTRYTQPGSFTLQQAGGPHRAHDWPSLLASLRRGHQLSEFHLIACEPNWIYPLCNTMSACATLAHDTQQGSTVWASQAARFRQQLEAEFLDGWGRYVPCRSARTGLALPPLGGVMPLAMPCFFLNALAPDLARRQWVLLRRRLFDEQGRWRRRAFWPIDTGNYGWSRASAYAATALAAAELGDEAVYRHCMAGLDDECPGGVTDGVFHRPLASVWSHGVELMARAGERDGFRHLMRAPRPLGGAHLSKLRYPDVLVAAAHAEPLQAGLSAVLYGGAGDGEQAVTVAGLQAHAHYTVTGAAMGVMQANALGELHMKVCLQGRTCLKVALRGTA
jgi:hypothetical protein